jgi:hypothetical protein
MVSWYHPFSFYLHRSDPSFCGRVGSCSWSDSNIFEISAISRCHGWDLIHTQHHHNNHTTTTHMSVGPSVWGPPSCEGLLCGCCISVVKFNIFRHGLRHIFGILSLSLNFVALRIFLSESRLFGSLSRFLESREIYTS